MAATRQRTASIAELVGRLRSGDVRALARAISLVEDDSALRGEILSACFPHSGNAWCTGITGSPGAGKSSLVDQLAAFFRSDHAGVGVIAVDPTSPYTAGALLGDRIRMEKHHADPDFYLRSMATRGALGGLAHFTADVAMVMDASGKQEILIETVGVGQDEVEVVRLADTTVLVLVPGMGDDIQSIKAGVMESADIFVINKMDRDGADRLETEVKAMQSHTARHAAWTPPIVRTNGLTGEGIPNLAAVIKSFRNWLGEEGRLEQRRTGQWKVRLREMIEQEFLRSARRRAFTEEELRGHAAAFVNRSEDPFRLVSNTVAEWRRA